MNRMKLTGAVVATAVAGLFLAGRGWAKEGDKGKQEKEAKVHCAGVNACAGKGACGGAGGCRRGGGRGSTGWFKTGLTGASRDRGAGGFRSSPFAVKSAGICSWRTKSSSQ